MWKRAGLLIFLILLISGCKTTELLSGGVNSKSEYSSDSYLEVAGEAEQAALAKYAHLELQSTATIERGDVKFDIDFDNKDDVAKIQDGDLIQLKKGYYLNFPMLYGKSVFIQGVSQNDTVIGDKKLIKKTAIRGKNLFFSKLALNKVFFWRVTDEEANHYTFFQVHINIWSSNERPVPHFSAFFTKVLDFSKTGLVDWIGNEAFYSYMENYYYAGSAFTSRVEKSFKTRSFGDMENPEFIKARAGDPVHPIEKIALENYKRDQFLTIDPQLKNDLQSFLQLWQKRLIEDRARIYDKDDAESKREANQLVYDYLNNLNGTGPSEQAIDPESEAYIAKAKEAYEEKRYLTASLLQGLALKNEALGNGADLIRADFIKYQNKAGSLYGCDLTTNEEGRIKIFEQKIKDIYPILGLKGPDSPCKLNYVLNIDNTKIVKSNSNVSETPVFEETRESMRRRFDLENARKEAEKAAWQAKATAVQDKLSQASTIFARSRASFHTVGNTQYMVYGKGTFSPQEDPLLKYSVNQAEAKLKALNSKSSAKEYEQVDTITETKYYAITELLYKSTLEMNLPGNKNILISGDLEKSIKSKYCTRKVDNQGRRVTKFDDFSSECVHTEESNMYQNKLSYVQLNIVDNLARPLYEFYFADVIKNIAKFENSTSKADQFEGELLKLALNYGVDENSNKIEVLSKEIVGKALPIEKIKIEITEN